MVMAMANRKTQANLILWGGFIIIATFHLLSIVFSLDQFAELSKYLLIPPLIAIVVLSPNKRYLLIVALIFSWLGDILLAQQKFSADFFIFGLVAFLIAHIFFILLNLKLNNRVKINLWHLFGIVPMLLWAFYLLSEIMIHAPNYLVPIAAYSLALCGLFFSGLLTRGRINNNSFKLLFIGIVLFIASDSMIAINKFIAPFAGSGFAIMFSYILAQSLMVLAYCHIDKNFDKPDEI